MAVCSPAFPAAVLKLSKKKHLSYKTAFVQSGLGHLGLLVVADFSLAQAYLK